MRIYKALHERMVRDGPLSLRAFALALTVVLLGSPAVTKAGALGKSVAKAAAARFGKTTARTRIPASLAKTNTSRLAAANEHAALQQQLRRLDGKALSRIEQRFGTYIAPRRMRHARSTQTRFLDHAGYQRQLNRTYPDLSAGRRQNVVGNYANGKTYVDRNQVLVPRTLAHERIHQLADPRFRQRAGSRLDEGMTEYFAGRIYGDLGILNLPTAYPGQRRVVQTMASRLGERSLARAYFSGEAGVLRKQLDSQLGVGAFDDIVRAMERSNHGVAAKILQAGR